VRVLDEGSEIAFEGGTSADVKVVVVDAEGISFATRGSRTTQLKALLTVYQTCPGS
jgi:hypothetical protein